jgi:membrane-associated phospholipid phosphatase
MPSHTKDSSVLFLSETVNSIITVAKSRYLYAGFLTVFTGVVLNIAAQTHLNNYVNSGNTLPALPDMILDNLPVIDLSLAYDIVCLLPIALMAIYLVHKRDFGRFPFILLMVGLFYIVRGVFVVLTPLGNPHMFGGSNPLFYGFAKYELGVFPSGHTGNVFMLFLLVNDSIYKKLILACLITVIITLLLSRAHYSIDILAAIFFAYAIRAFGIKHFSMFDLSDKVANS